MRKKKEKKGTGGSEGPSVRVIIGSIFYPRNDLAEE